MMIYAYADDMFMVSTSIRELQESFDDLAEWTEDNSLQMNIGKTEMMVFRRGGKVRCEDKIAYGRDYRKVVNSYKYLGITLQPSGTAYKRENAVSNTGHGGHSELEQAVTKNSNELFDLKIVPILTYGLTIWEYLGVNNLKTLESVKATYLKKALRVSRCTPSRLVYVLARECLLVEDLRLKLLLPYTDEVNKVITERR
jgi:hypothetical protein